MSIKLKLVITSLLVLVISTPIYYTVHNYYTSNHLNKEMESYYYYLSSKLDQYYRLVAEYEVTQNEVPIHVDNFQVFSDIFKFMTPAIEQIRFLDQETGEKLYQYYLMDHHQLSGEVAEASEADSKEQLLNHKTFYIEPVSSSLYSSVYYSAEQHAPWIHIYFDKHKFNAANPIHTQAEYWLLLLMMIASITAVYYIFKKELRPLNALFQNTPISSNLLPIQQQQIGSRDLFNLNGQMIAKYKQVYEECLRRSQEDVQYMKGYLESFINQSNDAIVMMDLHGQVIQTNTTFERLFGYTKDKLQSCSYPTIPQQELKRYKDMLDLLSRGHKLPAYETYRVTSTGEEIPMHVTVAPIYQTNGQVHSFFNMMKDMRFRNRMEELLRRSEKLKTVGQLAAGVAHEIRNPLTALKGFLQLQQQSNVLNQMHVTVMLTELERINYIVGEFLILAKPQAIKFEKKDVSAILQEVLEFLNSEAHLNNIEFVHVVSPQCCNIACEENQLKQVFINVLKNAMEAMPNGGRIYISIHRWHDNVKIEIRDEGVGIPADMLEKVGDPFFTVKESGTGLGIMVSRSIIHNHHGTFEIASKEGSGTTVKLLFPSYREESLGKVL